MIEYPCHEGSGCTTPSFYLFCPTSSSILELEISSFDLGNPFFTPHLVTPHLVTMSDDEKKNTLEYVPSTTVGSTYDANLSPQQSNAVIGGLHRRLNNRQIQLIAIGGSIGTALFISIGEGLAHGGPGSLFIAYTLYSCILALVTNSIAEMNTYMPVAGGFVRLAGHWVDDAFGFMAGWNFFICVSLGIPFEITALNLVLSFWNSDLTNQGPIAGVCLGVTLLYG